MPVRAVVTAGVLLVVVGSLLVGLAPSDPAESQAQRRSSVTGLRHVSSLELPAPHGDVWFHAGHAYLGTWSEPCPGNGVKIIDVRDPATPRLVASLATYPNTSAEDVIVHRVSTPRFDGDLLAVGLQPCTPDGKAGLDLWDVSDPVAPKHLAYFFIPPGGVHELSMIQRQADKRVLALLAVPHAEPSFLHGEFRVVDVTDPYLPVLASEWGIVEHRGAPPEAAVGAFPAVYAHSAIPSPDGMTAYVSYWDAGVVILDIRDPERPRYLGNTSYAAGDEGNAHSADADTRRDLLFQADEDVDHRDVTILIASPPEIAGEVNVVEAGFGPHVNATLTIRATLVPAGRGCANDTYPRDLTNSIALVERGDCAFTEKIEKAQAAGALAAIVINNIPGPAMTMFGENANVTIPAYMIDLPTGTRLRAGAQNGTTTAEISESHIRHDRWGFLRIYDIHDPARPRPVGNYTTPHSRNEPAAETDGSFTIHNPVSIPREALLVASWFSDGIRILDVHDPTNTMEIAHWIPPDPAGATPFGRGIWGVFVNDDTVYASDMSAGLHILQLERG